MACTTGSCSTCAPPIPRPPAPPPPPPPASRRDSCCTVRDIDRTAIMVCMTCPHARASRFHFCTLNGEEIARKACDRSGIMATAALRAGRGCPLGLAPDAKGRVRWLDETWLGLPWPRRFLLLWPLRLWWGTPRLTRPIDGCGCQRELRIVWQATKRQILRFSET